LTQQGDFQNTLIDQRADLGQDVSGRAIQLPAPQRRHDAERAGVVAADRDGNPRRIGGFAGRGQRGGEFPQRLGDLDLGGSVVAGSLQQCRQRADVVGAEDHVDPWRPSQHRVAVLLGEAPADGDLHVGVGLLARSQVAEVAVQLVVGVLSHRAGVEHHHVGVSALWGAAVAGGLQQAGEALGVMHIHLAAVGADLVGARRRCGG
jgi:hypothetical protein